MKIRNIIFIVIAVVLVFVGFSSKDTSKEADVISKAVYVADGKILPENEGKIVIVAGEINAVTPLMDELTGVELPGIKAKRNVERYQMEHKTEDEKSYNILEWKATILGEDNEFNELVSSNLIADSKLGEFEVDTKILNSVSTGKKYHNIDENVAYRNGCYVTTYEDTTYLTKAEFMPYGGEDYNASFTYNSFSKAYYRDYENMPRISYTIPYEENSVYTLIGRQQNGKIMYDKDLGMQAAFDGLQNPEQLAERVASGGMIGAIVAWVIAAFFALLAVLGMKKKKEN